MTIYQLSDGRALKTSLASDIFTIVAVFSLSLGSWLVIVGSAAVGLISPAG